MILHLNGRFLERDEAGLDPLERGYLLGEGVFETIRAEEGHPLHFPAHEARLRDGLRVLGIPFGMTGPELLGICQQVLDANALRFARIRVTVSAGAGDGTPGDTARSAATLAVHAVAIDPAACAALPPPIVAAFASFPLNERSPLARVKCTSYADRLLARREARAAGADEAFVLNTQDRVAEGAMSNLFAVMADGTLTTPGVAEGALPGVMRGELLRLAPLLGLSVREGMLTRAELDSARELFLTSAIRQVVPIGSVVGAAPHAGAPGPITRSIHTAYRESVAAYLADVRKS